MPSPKISVIVPVYNTEKYLRRCVDSILAQTFTDFELLLIYDGSKDCSGAICDEYAAMDSRVRVFHQLNGGVSSARNLGLDNAQGEWIAFCDSDDLTTITWLANYVVESACDVELIIQGFESDKIGFGQKRDSKTVSFDYDGNVAGLIQILLQNNALGFLWCKLFRTRIIKENKLRFDENMCFREDEMFLLNYLPYVRRAQSHKETGYFYFMPEWDQKYGLKYKEESYIYDQADKIISNRIIDSGFKFLQNFYIDSRNYNLMVEFDRTHERKYLKQIRQLLLKYPDSTRLSPYLKSIISIDRSMTLSWIALYGHMKIKKILGK